MLDPEYLLPEIFDCIVDILHDKPETLKECCLVSKSWVPRTRKHLFADIKIRIIDDLKSWNETFPDPSTSPARHVKTLSVGCPHVVVAACVDPGSWTAGFSSVVHLEVTCSKGLSFADATVSLTPFRGFSPAIKSLRVDFTFLPSSRIFDLILSFPLLEDLALIAYEASADNSDGHDLSATTHPLNPPTFTGSLDLSIKQGIKPIAHQLLSLPGGIYFRKLTFTWFHEEDPSSTMALINKCSPTLESLSIVCGLGGGARSVSIDLSRATKLKDVEFRPGLWNVQWVTITLQTITSALRDLRQISIYLPSELVHSSPDLGRTIGEEIRRQWLDLDRLLVQLWESRSIHPMVTYATSEGESWSAWVRDNIEGFLPEITRRGAIDFVE